MHTRRAALALLCAGCVPASANPAPRTSDDGSPVRTFEIASDKVRAGLAGAQLLGADDADVLLVEWFDYNCGFCRQANGPLDAILDRDPRLALALAHFPILSPSSVQAAAVQHAVYRRDGAAPAAALHRALLALRGRADLASAQALCSDLQIVIPSQAALDAAAAEVGATRKNAARLGLKYTPTFWIAGTAMIGWPGPRTIEGLVAAARQCGSARCD